MLQYFSLKSLWAYFKRAHHTLSSLLKSSNPLYILIVVQIKGRLPISQSVLIAIKHTHTHTAGWRLNNRGLLPSTGFMKLYPKYLNFFLKLWTKNPCFKQIQCISLHSQKRIHKKAPCSLKSFKWSLRFLPISWTWSFIPRYI